MVKADPNDLAYGHLGKAAYDQESEEWHFNRFPGIARCLRPVIRPSITVNPTRLAPASHVAQLAYNRNKQIGRLIDADASLAPAAFLLPQLAQISEAILDSTSVADSLTSNLLAFGKAAKLHKGGLRKKTVDIAAIASGSNGENVQLLRLNKDDFHWHREGDARLSSDTLRNAKSGLWTVSDCPIQQLCFSEGGDESGDWLAVRSSDITTILKPVLQVVPLDTESSARNPELASSAGAHYLNPNPVLILETQRTGGEAHVDVAFNPWNACQFGVLDTHGRWSIWNIDDCHQRKDLWSLRLGASSHGLDDVILGEPIEVEDGWGALLWAGDSNTIVTVNRTAVAFYSIATTTQLLISPDLGLVRQHEWVLDIKRSPVNVAHIFILTSLRILWINIIEHEKDSQRAETPCAELLLSIRHFRSPDDKSLQLHMTGSTEVMVTFLYSKISTIMTCFHFAQKSALQLPQSISDPSFLHLERPMNETHDGVCAEPLFSTLHVLPLAHSNSLSLEDSQEEDPSIQLRTLPLKLFVQYSDFSIHEHICASLSQSPSSEENSLTLISKKAVPEKTERVFEDDFIVYDDALVALGDGLDANPQRIFRQASRPLASLAGRKRISASEWLAESIEDWKDNDVQLDTASSKSFGQFMTRITSAVPSSACGLQTLFEILPTISLNEIETTSQILQETLRHASGEEADPHDDIEHDSNDKLRIVPLHNFQGFDLLRNVANSDHSAVLIDLYQDLLGRWMDAMCQRVPSRARIKLEKEIRKAAIQLYVASQGVHRGYNLLFENDRDRTADESRQQIEIPLRRKTPVGSVDVKGKGKAQDISSTEISHEFPMALHQQSNTMLPTPEATPSLHSRHSSFSFAADQDSAYARLSRIVSLKPQPPLPDPATKLLSHWQVGGNPEDYDWNKTRLALPSSNDVDGLEGSLMPQQPRKVGKKRPRQVSQAESSQVMAIRLYGSQPIGLASSSQSAPPAISLSQPERGVHGGSQSLFKKKHNRKSGF